MRGVLGTGVSLGLVTALWCMLTGGSLLLALVSYSAVGTIASLLAGLVLMAGEEGPEMEFFAE